MKAILTKMTLCLILIITSVSFAKPVESITDERPAVEWNISDAVMAVEGVRVEPITNLNFTTMSKVTKAQIQEWKDKYGIVYELESEGKKAYVFDPSYKLYLMKMIATSAYKGGESAMAEAVINNCWLGGDPEFKTDDTFVLGIRDEVAELIQMPVYDVEIKEDHAIVEIPGYENIRLKLATRGDIKYAEIRNKEDKPFDTAIHLLDRIADKEVVSNLKKDNRSYMALLMAANKVKDKKYVAVKKL